MSSLQIGAPFVRNDFPALKVLGYTGVLNSTSKVVVAATARGLTLDAGVYEAEELWVAEAVTSFDLDALDSAARAAALANVLMEDTASLRM